MILRVGHLRNCEYELQQHRRLARSRGLDAETQARIFAGPDAEGLTDRQRVLITATDEFVVTRGVSPETWQMLAGHYDQAAADRILHAHSAIRWAGRDHRDTAGSAGLPGLRRSATARRPGRCRCRRGTARDRRALAAARGHVHERVGLGVELWPPTVMSLRNAARSVPAGRSRASAAFCPATPRM